jgi:sec-independent protein translocase protein TatA
MVDCGGFRRLREVKGMAPLAILGLGVQELVIILVIVLVLFGAKRIPEIMRGLGQGVHGFKKGIRGEDEAADDDNGDNSKGSPSS